MLTPKHRALFHAAYSAPLMRSGKEENDLPPETTADEVRPRQGDAKAGSPESDTTAEKPEERGPLPKAG